MRISSAPEGGIKYRSPRHRLHSSLLVVSRRRSLIIDFGLDWLERAILLEPQPVLLTHAHPDGPAAAG